jgi:chromatin remodeling complex protein RSC6
MSSINTSTTKTTKKVKVKAAPKPEVVEVVEELPKPQVVEEPPKTEVVEEDEQQLNSMRTRFERLIKAKQDLILELKKEVQELRKMQRDHDNELKEASKKRKRKIPRDDTTPRKPSGFAAPVNVSDELYSFLEQFGVKRGELVARTDVTKYITSYIKEKDLQNPEHRREIIPDAALSKILGPAQEQKDPSDAGSPKIITYLKLQKYLSHHFIKK